MYSDFSSCETDMGCSVAVPFFVWVVPGLANPSMLVPLHNFSPPVWVGEESSVLS